MTSRRILWAMPYEEEEPLTEARASAIAGLGIDVLRPTDRMYLINPAWGVFNFDPTRLAHANARAAGLHVLPTVCYPPKWMSGGHPTYEEYLRGCAYWRAPITDPNPLAFDTSKDYCVNPPHLWDSLDPHPMPTTEDGWRKHNTEFYFHSPVYQFFAEYMRRVGGLVWAIAGINEPGGNLYWPPIHSEDRNGDAVVRLFEEVLIPMVRGARAVNPRMQFVGPEADGSDILRRCLEYERKNDLHVFDAISVHPYKLDNPSVFATIDQFETVIAKGRIDHDDDRPVFHSECGFGDQAATLDALDRIVNRDDRDVSLIGIQRSGLPDGGWFEPGSWEADKPVANRWGKELRKWIAAQNEGRSARLHI